MVSHLAKCKAKNLPYPIIRLGIALSTNIELVCLGTNTLAYSVETWRAV
jgi:hypothetical protein